MDTVVGQTFHYTSDLAATPISSETGAIASAQMSLHARVTALTKAWDLIG